MSKPAGISKPLRWVAVLLFVLLLILQWKLWVSSDGVRGTHVLHQKLEAQAAQNRELEKRNQAYAADVKDLKHGERAIEARARDNLGLIKPGETFYQVIGPAPAGTTAAVHRP